MLGLLAGTTWMARHAVSAIEGRVANIPPAISAALAAEQTAVSVTTLRWHVAVYTGSERGSDLRVLRDDLDGFEALLTNQDANSAVIGHPGFARVRLLASELVHSIEQTIELTQARRSSIAELVRTGAALTIAASALSELLVHDAQFAQLPAALHLQETLQSAVLAGTRFVASRAPADADADAAQLHIEHMAMVTPALILALAQQPRLQRQLAVLTDKRPAYIEALHALLANLAALEASMTQRQQVGAELASDIAAIRESFLGAQQQDVQRTLDVVARARSALVWMTIASLVTGLLATWIIGRSVTRPLRALVGTMRRLASGDTALLVRGCGLRDEIGEMARNVEIFRQGAVERARLQAEREVAGSMAARDRRRVVEDVAVAFEEQVRGVVEAVASRAEEMQSASRFLATSAAATHARMLAVMGQSGEASCNVEAVAVAAGGLAVSIARVSCQIGRTAEVARQAAERTGQTHATLGGLTEAVARIGSMTKLIRTIAGQTKMLALNAAIEAARAGDAGQGFGVVANEVKDLAQQTSLAAETISGQIAGIEEATRSMVKVIGAMGETTAEVDLIAASVAVAVAEQSEATARITLNAQTAARGTHDISATVLDVGDSSRATGTAAEKMVGASRALGLQADNLRATASEFLLQIAAAA